MEFREHYAIDYCKVQKRAESFTETFLLKRKKATDDPIGTSRLQCIKSDDVRDRYNVNNQGRPFQRNNARGNIIAGNVGGQNRVGNMIWSDRGGDERLSKTKRCYLTEVIPFFKTLKEHFVGVQKALFKEVKVMEEIFDQMNDEVDQNTVDKQCAEIERKNLLIANENLIANCLSNQLLYDVEKSRCLDLEAEMSKPYNANDVTALIEQNECVRVELEEVKQHYKELIGILKGSIRSNLKVAARVLSKTKVLAPGECRNMFREIVEEARVAKPLDNVLTMLVNTLSFLRNW
ncbi:hypothetical protein Tco_1541009 [Tanacetum coccineum]